ncbi:hypothetical protein HDU76_004350 [Blyttiomyces sp. JEL0837]|nr:hypothetical protein HDU76_004350 [Blyttiomyces sp. JEL0837]
MQPQGVVSYPPPSQPQPQPQQDMNWAVATGPGSAPTQQHPQQHHQKPHHTSGKPPGSGAGGKQWSSVAAGGNQSQQNSSATLIGSVTATPVYQPAQQPSGGPAPVPTQSEINDFSLAVQKVWELDLNRRVPGVHYKLDLQQGKKAFEEGDVASRPLFAFVDEKALLQIPTFNSFYNLLNNYEKRSGVSEVDTPEKRREVATFISSLLATKPIQYAQAYLAGKGKGPKSLNEFGELLQKLWFQTYKRQAANDSSAFEHVFCGELRDGQVVGGHNWIQFWSEERARRIDYQGYIFPKRRNGPRPEDHPHLLTLQFTWANATKPLTSLFIGTSPEFEFAVYTMAFCLGSGGNSSNRDDDGPGPKAVLEDVDVEFKVHRFFDRAGERIGSVYPVFST